MVGSSAYWVARPVMVLPAVHATAGQTITSSHHSCSADDTTRAASTQASRAVRVSQKLLPAA